MNFLHKIVVSEMSTKDKYDDDDYVAKLLAEDAKKSSLKYAATGMSALLSRRPTGSAPKPNTRFLKNLVRDADNHNAALKKKEELEARIRLRKIQEKEDRQSGKRGHARERKRKRLDDDHSGHSHGERSAGPKKRRRSSTASDVEERPRLDKNKRHGKNKATSDRKSRHKHEDRGSSKDSRSSKDLKRRSSVSSRKKDDQHRSQGYHTSGDSKSTKPHRAGHNDKKRSRSRSRSTSTSDEERSHSKRKDTRLTSSERTHSPSSSSTSSLSSSSSSSTSSQSSSDPLEGLVGPIPSKVQSTHRPRIRGRGAHRTKKASSNIDAHFSSTYDPTRDAAADTDEGIGDDDDWGMALDALKVRSKWKQKQADRMRNAGWDEATIKRWKTTGGERSTGPDKDISHVKWVKKGEDREWDKGKKLDQ